jgi:hypothetical protein
MWYVHQLEDHCLLHKALEWSPVRHWKRVDCNEFGMIREGDLPKENAKNWERWKLGMRNF